MKPSGRSCVTPGAASRDEIPDNGRETPSPRQQGGVLISPYGRAVTELLPGMAGQWLVVTQTSSHLWDLDAMTYTRQPGASSRSGSFDFDRRAMALTRVQRWPRVGATFLAYYDDPTEPDRIEHWRQSSRVESITEILCCAEP